MKTLFFMFGLPGAGKTTWIKENLSALPRISADFIKKTYDDYDPDNPGAVHERSVKDAEKLFYTNLEESEDFSFDGGGISNSYSTRLITAAKKAGWKVVLVHIDTPLAVCLERNRERARTVPEEALVDKAVKLTRCLAKLSLLVDEVVTESYYTDKYLFFDMDGTLAAYQFLPIGIHGGIDFVDGEHFRYAPPVKPMLNRAEEFSVAGHSINILSAIPDGMCMVHKKEWLSREAPFIPDKNQHFIGNKRFKHEMLRNLLKKRKISFQDVLVIDDDHKVLDQLNSIGIHAVHPSMFLCMNPKGHHVT